jgi:hypothetical protein
VIVEEALPEPELPPQPPFDVSITWKRILAVTTIERNAPQWEPWQWTNFHRDCGFLAILDEMRRDGGPTVAYLVSGQRRQGARLTIKQQRI